MKAQSLAVLGVLGVGLVAALYVWRKGGIAPAASALGAAVVDGAGGLASGAVGAVGSTVGLPTPNQTTTDPAVARYLIDVAGLGFASRWAGLPALAQAAFMAPGSGRAPAVGSAAYDALLAQARPAGSSGDFARLDRADYYETSGRIGNGADERTYDQLGNLIY